MTSPSEYPYIASNRDFTQPAQTIRHLYLSPAEYQIMDNAGKLTFYMGPYPQPPAPSPQPAKPTKEAPVPPPKIDEQTWLGNVLADIDARQAASDPGRVMIFIHGFANPWSKVVGSDTTSAPSLFEMVSHFWTLDGLEQEYPGPIVLLDWPSDSITKDGPYKHAQSVAVDTAQLSFKALDGILQSIVSQRPGTLIDIVCHSLGNYVLVGGDSGTTGKITGKPGSPMVGAGYLTPGSISRCLMNGAAIANMAFASNLSSLTDAGGVDSCLDPRTGAAIVFFNNNDNALPAAPDPWNPGWPIKGKGELGYSGVMSDKTYPSFKGQVDCTQQIQAPISDCGSGIHTAYYCDKDVVNLMISLMMNSMPTSPLTLLPTSPTSAASQLPTTTLNPTPQQKER